MMGDTMGEWGDMTRALFVDVVADNVGYDEVGVKGWIDATDGHEVKLKAPKIWVDCVVVVVVCCCEVVMNAGTIVHKP